MALPNVQLIGFSDVATGGFFSINYRDALVPQQFNFDADSIVLINGLSNFDGLSEIIGQGNSAAGFTVIMAGVVDPVSFTSYPPFTSENTLINSNGDGVFVYISDIGNPLTLVCSTNALSPGLTTSFLAQGGWPPYLYSIVSGGGSINSGTGLYTAPNSYGVTVVGVTDIFGGSP